MTDTNYFLPECDDVLDLSWMPLDIEYPDDGIYVWVLTNFFNVGLLKRSGDNWLDKLGNKPVLILEEPVMWFPSTPPDKDAWLSRFRAAVEMRYKNNGRGDDTSSN